MHSMKCKPFDGTNGNFSGGYYCLPAVCYLRKKGEIQKGTGLSAVLHRFLFAKKCYHL